MAGPINVESKSVKLLRDMAGAVFGSGIYMADSL
jgi:hypothetical protein